MPEKLNGNYGTLRTRPEVIVASETRGHVTPFTGNPL